MAAPVIFQRTPFGFNVIKLGTLEVFTGKVRIKGIEYKPNRPYLNVEYRNGYCIASFEVIDRHLAKELYKELGKLCKEVAQSKLEQKWKWLNN